MSLSLADGVSIAETDDGAVLLDERTGRYWRLNGSGARLLQALLAGRDTPRPPSTRPPGPPSPPTGPPGTPPGSWTSCAAQDW